MRAGKVCTDCLDRRSVWPALQHGCYRNSRLATLLIVVVALVMAFDALSRRIREKLL